MLPLYSNKRYARYYIRQKTRCYSATTRLGVLKSPECAKTARMAEIAGRIDRRS
jgi:hypothetical protein